MPKTGTLRKIATRYDTSLTWENGDSRLPEGVDKREALRDARVGEAVTLGRDMTVNHVGPHG